MLLAVNGRMDAPWEICMKSRGYIIHCDHHGLLNGICY